MALTTKYIRGPKNEDEEFGMGYQNTLVSTKYQYIKYSNKCIKQQLLNLNEKIILPTLQDYKYISEMNLL